MMGRHAKLLTPEMGCAVHIVMERSTAKTMECFVEFMTPGDASKSMRYLNGGLPAHPPRLGPRFVQIELSTQDELLDAMFPRAKCVSWHNGVPYIVKNTDPYSTGFQGFFTHEEFYNIVRHAEHPRRVRLQKILLFSLISLFRCPPPSYSPFSPCSSPFSRPLSTKWHGQQNQL